MSDRAIYRILFKNRTRKRLRRSTCGAAFDYAIAVPEGQIGGRYDLFLFNRTQHPASILRSNFLLNKKQHAKVFLRASLHIFL